MKCLFLCVFSDACVRRILFYEIYHGYLHVWMLNVKRASFVSPLSFALLDSSLSLYMLPMLLDALLHALQPAPRRCDGKPIRAGATIACMHASI